MRLEIEQGKYKGYVVLPDFLNIVQVRKFEDALGDPNDQPEENKRIWFSVSDSKRLPVILELVKEWHIDGLPEKPTLETFPMTPLAEAHALVNDLFMGVYRLWSGEQVPND